MHGTLVALELRNGDKVQGRVVRFDLTTNELYLRNKPGITPAKAESAAAPSPPPVAKEPEMDREAQFVTFLHDDACRRFGTVLGPDANAAHKNHFHLDMKKRRKGFCE